MVAWQRKGIKRWVGISSMFKIRAAHQMEQKTTTVVARKNSMAFLVKVSARMKYKHIKKLIKFHRSTKDRSWKSSSIWHINLRQKNKRYQMKSKLYLTMFINTIKLENWWEKAPLAKWELPGSFRKQIHHLSRSISHSKSCRGAPTSLPSSQSSLRRWKTKKTSKCCNKS